MTINNISSDILKTEYKDNLLNRFLNYAKTYSESDSEKADSGLLPSTPQQKNMADLLNAEMKKMGLKDVQTTENMYTYGYLEASKGFENAPSFCLLAHIDTSDAVSGENVKPIIHENYTGNIIKLPAGIELDPCTDKNLARAAKENDTIISSDGSTLLGADDKAGIAEILTAIEFLIAHPEIRHGKIEMIFSPDEETGHGMDKVPLDLLKSKFAYTVDGGHIGELEKECFNAVKSDVTFYGKSIHPGSARPDYVSAVNMAAAFVSSLPHNQQPETTDGFMGFYSAQTITGSVEEAKIMLILRDFTKEGIEKRQKMISLIADTTAETFGGKAEVKHTLQYLNMREKLDQNPKIVEVLEKSYRDAGVEPVTVPIRGGTDGSRLTEMGIPTPNIFTGGHNFHSRYEWASLRQMIYATEVIIQLAQNWSGEKN